MHQQREIHRKQSACKGVRVVDLSRGLNGGFGFTLSGQSPCVLSNISRGSSAEKAGLKPGDYLISIDGRSVSKSLHDEVVGLIGNAKHNVRLQISENYRSDSSDFECSPLTAPKSKLKFPTRRRHRRSKSVKRNSEATNSNLTEKCLKSLTSADLVRQVTTRAVNNKENGTTSNEMVFYKLDKIQCTFQPIDVNRNQGEKLTVYRTVVAYLGTIEMPKEPGVDGCSNEVKNSIRRLRLEKKIHTLVLLTMLPDKITLENAQGAKLAEYSAEKIRHCGVHLSDRRFFGLVTVNKADKALINSCSCHVFWIDPKLVLHSQHSKAIRISFIVNCSPNEVTGLCDEFPDSAVVVLKMLNKFYGNSVSLEKHLDGDSNRGSQISPLIVESDTSNAGFSKFSLDLQDLSVSSAGLNQSTASSNLSYNTRNLNAVNKPEFIRESVAKYIKRNSEFFGRNLAAGKERGVPDVDCEDRFAVKKKRKSSVYEVNPDGAMVRDLDKLTIHPTPAPRSNVEVKSRSDINKSNRISGTPNVSRSDSRQSGLYNETQEMISLTAFSRLSDGSVHSAQFLSASSSSAVTVSTTTVAEGPQIVVSGASRVSMWAKSFDHLLQDLAGIHTFSEFLRKEFSSENIFFWVACERFKNITDQQKMKRFAMNIYNRHLEKGASESVNVDSKARQMAEQSLTAPNVNMFSAAQIQIYNLMRFDCYSRFLRSSVYEESLVCEAADKDLPYNGLDELNPNLEPPIPPISIPKFEFAKPSMPLRLTMSSIPGESRVSTESRKSLLRSSFIPMPWTRRFSKGSGDTQSKPSVSSEPESNNEEDGSMGLAKKLRCSLRFRSKSTKSLERKKSISSSQNSLDEVSSVSTSNNLSGSRSSLLSGELALLRAQSGIQRQMSCDSVSSTGSQLEQVTSCRLCRIILPDMSTGVVQTSVNETVGSVVSKFLDRRQLVCDAFEVYMVNSDSTQEQLDLTISSSLLSNREVAVVYRCLFFFELPQGRILAVKCKKGRYLADIVRLLLVEACYALDHIRLFKARAGKMVLLYSTTVDMVHDELIVAIEKNHFTEGLVKNWKLERKCDLSVKSPEISKLLLDIQFDRIRDDFSYSDITNYVRERQLIVGGNIISNNQQPKQSINEISRESFNVDISRQTHTFINVPEFSTSCNGDFDTAFSILPTSLQAESLFGSDFLDFDAVDESVGLHRRRKSMGDAKKLWLIGSQPDQSRNGKLDMVHTDDRVKWSSPMIEVGNERSLSENVPLVPNRPRLQSGSKLPPPLPPKPKCLNFTTKYFPGSR